MTSTAVVVGLGSIGTRHARVLRELGLRVATVSRREGGDYALEFHADLKTLQILEGSCS